MPALRDINKKDDTASKPDTGKYGLEPFLGATGYALVVCCPIYTIVGIVGAIVLKVKQRKLKKAEQQGAGEKTDTAGDDEHSGAEGRRRRKRDGDPTTAGIKRTVSPPRVTHGFKGDPNDPRQCRPECPGFGKKYCAAHHASDQDRPTSPGLLAV